MKILQDCSWRDNEKAEFIQISCKKTKQRPKKKKYGHNWPYFMFFFWLCFSCLHHLLLVTRPTALDNVAIYLFI